MILVEPDEARQTADDVLSRPEYREAPPSLTDRVLDWIGDVLGDLLGLLAAGGDTGGLLIGYFILALALALAGYVAWRVYPRGGGRQRRAGPAIELETEIEQTRDEWLAEAAAAESAADWDRAVHARYHALVTGLADRGRLPAEPSTTSGEHLRAFADWHDGSDGDLSRFAEATDRYERVWFGGIPAGHRDASLLAEADRALLGPPALAGDGGRQGGHR